MHHDPDRRSEVSAVRWLDAVMGGSVRVCWIEAATWGTGEGTLGVNVHGASCFGSALVCVLSLSLTPYWRVEVGRIGRCRTVEPQLEWCVSVGHRGSGGGPREERNSRMRLLDVGFDLCLLALIAPLSR